MISSKNYPVWFGLFAALLIGGMSIYFCWQILTAKVVINDAGLFAELSRIVLEDNRSIYTDLWDNKPPVLFIFIAFFIAIFGTNTFAIQMAGLALIAVFSGSIFLFLRWHGAKKIALLIAVLLASFYGAIIIHTRGAETSILMASFGALGFALITGKPSSWLWLLLAGAAFSLGVFSKQPLALEFPAVILALWLYHENKRFGAFSMWAIGAALALLIMGLWALWEGNLLLIGEYVIWGNVGYASDYVPYWEYVWRETLPIMLPLAILACLSLIRLWYEGQKRFTLLLFTWLVMAFMGSIIGKALKITYFVQLMPVLIILVALGAEKLFELRPKLFSLAALTLPLVFILSTQGYLWAFVDFVAQQHDENSPVLETASYLAANTDTEDCLWLWGYINNLSYYSGRRSCTAVPYEAMVMNAEAFNILRYRSQYLHDLYENLPSFHIENSPWSYFPMLETFFRRYRGELIEDFTYRIFTMDFSSLHKVSIRFQNLFTMIAYDDFQGMEVCTGQELRYAMTWRVEQSPNQYYQMFLQLRDGQNNSLVSVDIIPRENYPTSAWSLPNEIVLSDTIRLSIPNDVVAGEYKVVMGFYNVDSLEPLQIWDEANNPIGTETTLTFLNLSTNCR